MAEEYTIHITHGAEADLRWFSAFAQRIILDGLEIHLRHQPTLGTRRIIALHPNPVAGWELRLGEYRVLFDVDEAQPIVTVQVIGEKRRDRLIVQGKEYTSHESHRS